MMTEKDNGNNKEVSARCAWFGALQKKFMFHRRVAQTDRQRAKKNSPLASSHGTQIAQQSRMERNWRLEMNESKQGANDK